MRAASPPRASRGSSKPAVEPVAPVARRKGWLAGLPEIKQGPLRCWPGGQGWLWGDNNGSYNGWFNWLPERLRVGPWHPTAIMFLAVYYCGLFWVRPSLTFPTSKVAVGSPWWWADVATFAWTLLVTIVSWKDYGGKWPYLVSYTGWSWSMLVGRAGFTAVGVLLQSEFFFWEIRALGLLLAHVGSMLHCPAIVGATVTFTIWNALLFPLLMVVLPLEEPKGDRHGTEGTNMFSARPSFLKLNFSFFLVNLHVLNLPLSAVTVIVGAGARELTSADLWMAFAVMALYSCVYLFGLDRFGLHFYPMFSPRSPLCLVAYCTLFAAYAGIWRACNAIVGAY